MNKVTIREIDVNNKKVFLRCDFNVPLDDNLQITDKTRIIAVLPTIKYLLERNAKLILCSHLGRPKGQRDEKLSLAPVAKELSIQLGKEVKLAKDIIGEDAKTLINNMQVQDVVLLENVRFDIREEQNDEEFSKELASLAEIYVNDAFGTCHRAHASTQGMAKYLPSACGFLIEKELKALGDALDEPIKPFYAILGGKKVSEKIGVIESLLEKADKLLIGGAMAYTFYKAMGYEVGNSICELDKLDLAKEIMKKAKDKGIKMIIPIDNKVGLEFKPDTESKVVKYNEIEEGWEGFDIGPETIELFKKELQGAKTIFWNGPLGLSEFDQFAIGTNSIAQTLADIDAVKIVGGGDSAAAIEKAGLSDKFTHISTGGSASLEFIEGKNLPGIEALQDKE